ncbi:winged helix-turn-helix transcriptional regulator [Streptomyces sp. NPDC002889]|uniref:winged helix-turn-helix transcriptional regulator n=1 Tax=Streptomyces sp. NPDC002889 TaxID=3364669 RepID=UPI0036B37256
MLTEPLRPMERNGFVSRTAYDENPPRVEYGLTSLGCSALDPMNVACDRAGAHPDELIAARDAHGGG